jgi:chemotaxis protein CheD
VATPSTWNHGSATARRPRVVVGIGELAVSDRTDDVIVTHALGSCIAVCIYDPVVHVAGMLHFLLPESKINPERARSQPGTFADTGIPLLLEEAARLGLEKKRAIVKLAGGAEIGEKSGANLQIGRRNLLAAKNLLWRFGVLLKGQDVGGNAIRTVYLSVEDGRTRISDGREQMKEL